MKYKLTEMLNELVYANNLLFAEFFKFWQIANNDEQNQMEYLLQNTDKDKGYGAIKFLEKIFRKNNLLMDKFYAIKGIFDDETANELRNLRNSERLRKSLRKRVEQQKLLNSFKISDILSPDKYDKLTEQEKNKYISKIKHIAKIAGITNIDSYDMHEVVIGLDVEKEHVNVANTVTEILKIALAHLNEKKNYYSLLLKYVE